MRPSRLGANHIAITWPTREAWLHQVEWLRLNDIKFHVRLDHGMTHSVYVSDPNGIGIEVLYEVPEEIWMNNIHEGLNYAARIDTPEDQPIQDNVDYKVFSS
jgi:catechol 2,3-dioxygenase